jgi:hypothetical protein
MNTLGRPADLVAIPPLARTIIYYTSALTLVVVSALTAYNVVHEMWLVIVGGVGGVFFSTAGSNVVAKPGGAVMVADTGDHAAGAGQPGAAPGPYDDEMMPDPQAERSRMLGVVGQHQPQVP